MPRQQARIPVPFERPARPAVSLRCLLCSGEPSKSKGVTFKVCLEVPQFGSITLSPGTSPKIGMNPKHHWLVEESSLSGCHCQGPSQLPGFSSTAIGCHCLGRALCPLPRGGLAKEGVARRHPAFLPTLGRRETSYDNVYVGVKPLAMRVHEPLADRIITTI